MSAYDVEKARQEARNEKIFQHWQLNIHWAVRGPPKWGPQDKAARAANAGWVLAEDLYGDIMDASSLISSIACDRLLELVEFCFSHAFAVGDTTWPEDNNGIMNRAFPPAQHVQVANWMFQRGLELVYDLYLHLQLHRELRAHLRQFLVQALQHASHLCAEKENAASDYFTGSPSTLSFWEQEGDTVLRFLRDDINSTDRIIRDAAEDAARDLRLRKEWRDSLRDRRLAELMQGTLFS